MPQGHEYENPQVRQALADLFRIERVPTRGKNVARHFFWDVETA
jgi:hypothetical protein